LNDKYIAILYQFLNNLKTKNPVKFKEFFVKIDKTRACDLFFLKKSILFDLVKSMQIEMAINYIRDLSLYPPSKNIIINIINLMDSFKNEEEFDAFVSVSARTLNIILIRTPANDLCDQFKIFLPKLAQKIQNHSEKCYKILFGEVT
jgi:hypothetical protein